MSIENGLSKLRHSVGALCIFCSGLLRVFAWVLLRISFQVAHPAENCLKFSIVVVNQLRIL